VPIYDNQSAGLTKKGDSYDTIAGFLASISRNPKPGEIANLTRDYLVGATGQVQLKVEIAEKGTLKGKEVNKVAFYIWNSETAAGTSTAITTKKQPARAPDDDGAPDDIPF
jgi:hypothetical protein